MHEEQAKISGCNYGPVREAQAGLSKAEKINEIFTYHPPQSSETAAKYETIRDAAKHLAHVMVKNTPQGSDQSAAIRLLREAVMTANAAIALNGMNF